MLELAPDGPAARRPTSPAPARPSTKAERTRRVILLAGCAQQVLRPEINDATIRLLARRGVDVEVAPGAGCCGALVHHMGREAGGVAMAKRNIDAWTRLIEKGDRVDAIIVNTSGCGTTVKDYGHMLAREPKYAERAAKLAAMTRDVTEFLGSYDMGPPKRWSSLRVAYHSACSMQHGQRIIEEPRKLLRNAGFTVHGGPRGPPLLRLGRHLQHPAAGDRRRSARAQGRQHPKPCAPTWSRPATSAASRSSPAAWTSPSPTPSSCSTGPTAARCRAASRSLSRHVQDVPEPKPLMAVT